MTEAGDDIIGMLTLAARLTGSRSSG